MKILSCCFTSIRLCSFILSSRSWVLCYYMMSFLFTGDSGEVFEVAPDDLSLPAPPHPYTSFYGASAANPMSEAEYVSSAMRPFPLIVVTEVNDHRMILCDHCEQRRRHLEGSALCLIKAVTVRALNNQRSYLLTMTMASW
jgi:hypothetical protein